jgi:DNA-binding CsgD family transcriptional regulator
MAVGRRAEREALATFLGGLGPDPAAVLIEGEPGIGKTTLWAEGIELAQARGFRVLSCRPSGSDAELALVGLGDLLRDVPDEALATLSEPERDALEVSLLRRPPAGRRPDPRAVALASLTLVRSLARIAPVVIAIDDEPSLDRATERVVAFTARRLAGRPVGLLLTRPDPDAAIPLGLADAIAPSHLSRLLVGPMTPDELAATIRAHVGVTLSVPEARRLAHISGGNPFIALEITHAAARGDEGVTGQALPIPRNLREDLVLSRIGSLPGGSLDLLLVAAAARRPTLDLLSAATDAQQMPRRLQSAIDAGLVGVAGSDVHFTHPLYRSVLYASASRVRRHAVHRRLAELALDLEERARHLALSAEGSDEATATTLDAAAALARDRGAPDAAAELLEHAIRLTPLAASKVRRRRHLDVTDHRYVAGDPAGAERHAREALGLSATGDERAVALRAIATLELERGAAGDARRSLEEAAAEPGVSGAIAAAVHGDLAEIITSNGDLLEAERCVRVALDRARRAKAEPVAVAARITRSRIALLKGNGDRLLTTAPPAGEPIDGAAPDRLGLVLAEAEMVVGRHDDARARLNSLRAAALERGDEPARRAAMLRLVEVELRDGAWGRAIGIAHEARELAGMFGQDGALETAYLAYAAALEGREEDARTLANRGIDAAGDHRQALAWSLGALGVLELSLGKADRAQPHLARVGAIAAEMGLGEPAWLPFLSDEAEVLVIVGDHEAASRHIAWLHGRGEALARGSAVSAALRSRALLLAEQGRVTDALACATSAADGYEELPLPFERGRSLLTLGALRRRDRQKRGARDALQRAVETFESLGARIWAERTRAELARISGRRTSLTELTESEARVASLAAAGRTNQEIARTLSMSVRTVEGHLSHAYAKLGLRSRTELSVFLDRGE